MSPLLLPLLVPFVAAVACAFFQKSLKTQRTISFIAASFHLIASCSLLQTIRTDGIQVYLNGGWPARIGIALVGDLFSGIMLVITGLISLTVLIYSFKEMDNKLQSRAYFPLFNFLMMGVNGSFITGDMFNLYVWFEVMLLSSFILLAMGKKADQLEGSIKYVTINLFSSILFLSGAAIIYAKTGSLNMADIAQIIANSPDEKLLNSTAVLLLSSFGIKSALFPMFLWLPASYHTPAVSISSLFAGLLTKVGVYAMIRTFTLIFPLNNGLLQDLFYVIAILTMVVGVLCAAAQYEIRKILSVHIVSQIGYMVLGISLFTPLGIAGAIFYLLHNIIVKTNLFLLSGVILRKKGSCELKEIGGLYKSYPYFSTIFVLSAFALAGIPPLSGFWAKFIVLKAAADSKAYLLLGVGLAVGVVTLFSMTKIWAEAFWKKQPEEFPGEGIDTGTAPWQMMLPILFLTLCTFGLGIFGESIFQLCIETSTQLLDPSQYIHAVLGDS
ncbi:proton-conducting transporter membrane subunit [Lentisphaera profundi]|uniref:Proton-conducting transporter membrane subunit n=1 Tax=Lentisphaera profundi TaxID=1658616 RepID=A0ABY7VN05_9BACT|nr:proton-conducting transporter membrane subunit [Lentisphaera profundi]WDE95451.1 proton-conducting transporter membrane subunit [Lentisphaera profundi]